MMTYIAHFTAKHRVVETEQHSIFIWQQESGEVDRELLANKIIRESSVHFFRPISEDNYVIEQDDISIKIRKALPFSG